MREKLYVSDHDKFIQFEMEILISFLGRGGGLGKAFILRSRFG